MQTRSVTMICASLGMFVGGYLPLLWGASAFSPASLLLAALGGVAGIWAGVRLSDF
jgi:hypothetical protein